MINSFFIKLDYNKYKSFINSNEYNKIILKNKDLTGNKLFKIFNIEYNYDKYLKYINYNHNNDNHIFIYNGIFYISKLLDITLNNLLSYNNTTYSKLMISKFINNNNDIFYSIKSLNLNLFDKLYKTNYLDVINYNNKIILPINYCNFFIKQYKNNIALNILYDMFNKLKNLNYNNTIHPIFFDIDNKNDYLVNNENIFNNINTLIDGLYFYKNSSDIIVKYINYFNLNYKNEKFILFINDINNKNNIDNVLNKIIYNNNYDYYILLLCINKINIFNEINLNNKNIIDEIIIYEPNLITYLINYNCKISFYYLIEKKNNIIINTKLSSDFFKIYINLLQIENSINLLNYINLFDDKLTEDEIKIIINNKYFDDSIKIKYIIRLLKTNNNNDYLINLIKTKYKKLFYTSEILINMINYKNEEIFVFLLNNSNEIEKDYILNKVIDNTDDDNTISHLICKNNICLGLKINNDLINKNGLKPLDLCIISKNFYE